MKTRVYLVALAMIGASACVVGPNYKRPAAAAPPAFKETPPANFKEAQEQGWKQSQPGDAFEKGKWWEIYNDPALNALEEQVSIKNENVLQAEAQYRAARAAITAARSDLFPVVGAGPAITESRGSTSGQAVQQNSSRRASFSLPLSVSWEPDFWGNIRRGVTAAKNTAQAFAADLENAKLLYQSELAQDYFGIHGIDAEADLLQRTATSYQEYLTLTRNRFAGGIASDLDVAQAESQLYGVQAQITDLGVQRAQFEHAIAILIGKPPSELTIPVVVQMTPPPPVPIGVPSELLERRPDIAGAERRAAAANEQIGIAMAAFYPQITLSGSAGFGGSTLANWFSWPSRVWTVGAGLSQTLFDAGRRKAVVVEEQAAYDATAAAYRQTVLTAFQQVEDNLAALRILADEEGQLQQTIQSADRALNVSTAQYRAGTTSFLTVITAQAALLGAQRSSVELLTRRLTASVLLVDALGGGWNTGKLPS